MSKAEGAGLRGIMSDNQDKIKEVYETFPYPNGIYDGTILGRFLLAKELKGKSVLDVGCGTGELSCQIAALGARVTAVDPSRSAILQAKRRKRQLGLKNIKFSVGDAQNLALRERFDVVSCVGVLQVVPDPYAAFQNLVKHAKQGGLVNIAVYNLFGGLPKRIKKSIITVFAGWNLQRRLRVAYILFGKSRPLTTQLKTKLIDTYCLQGERHFSVGKILRWFRMNDIIYTTSSPPIELSAVFMERYFVTRPYLRSLAFLRRIPNNLMGRLILQAGWFMTQREVFAMLGRKR